MRPRRRACHARTSRPWDAGRFGPRAFESVPASLLAGLGHPGSDLATDPWILFLFLFIYLAFD